MADFDAPGVLRACAGCPGYDAGPRAHVFGEEDGVKLYHYDCLPAEHHSDKTAAIVAAAVSGTKNESLRAFAVEHAANLVEDAPDDTVREVTESVPSAFPAFTMTPTEESS